MKTFKYIQNAQLALVASGLISLVMLFNGTGSF